MLRGRWLAKLASPMIVQVAPPSVVRRNDVVVVLVVFWTHSATPWLASTKTRLSAEVQRRLPTARMVWRGPSIA